LALPSRERGPALHLLVVGLEFDAETGGLRLVTPIAKDARLWAISAE